MVGSIPEFVLDEEGTRRLVPSHRADPKTGTGQPGPVVGAS